MTATDLGLPTTAEPVRAAAPAAGSERSHDAAMHGASTELGLRRWLPSVLAVLNAIAFVLVRPDVNDLWAARARASAVTHGVGLFYWFGWFGGSTPGNYSVLSPYLCSLIGTELAGALAAVSVTVLATVLVRRLSHPVAASAVAAVCAGINLWSGRVPFLLGSAVALGAVIALGGRRRFATVALTLLSILLSPVSGAFVALGLSGMFLTTRTRQWRRPIAWVVGTVGLALIGVALLFGTPGPEPFPVWLAFQLLCCLLLMRVASPPDWVRTTLGASALAVILLCAIPNGMGSNVARFIWFCLPVLVVATSRRRAALAVLVVAPVIALGGSLTVTDLRNAVQPVSSIGYYDSLAKRLDAIAGLANYRVEVVNHGAHAGYDALLPHAALARGWETQEDNALNAALAEDPLDPITYRVWLENNAVGYVALPAAQVQSYPEYTLVQHRPPRYLHRIWRNANWQLFRVDHPTPIVGSPASLLSHTQSSMSITVPCICTVKVRARYSKFLAATLVPPVAPAGGAVAPPPDVRATVADDGTGWTTITTTRAGLYRLAGSIGGLLR